MRFKDSVRKFGFYEIGIVEYLLPKLKISKKDKGKNFFIVTSRFEYRDGKLDIHIYRTPYLDENTANAIYGLICKDWSRSGPRTWNSVRRLCVLDGGYVKDVS